MERVKRGELYWYVTPLFNVDTFRDNRGNSSNKDFKTGNYFLTCEEALEQAIKNRTFFNVGGHPEIL